MRKTNWTKRVLPIILAAVLLVGLLPASAAPQDEIAPVAKITREDISKREESSKTFICEDGSMITVLYAGPVHFESRGEWLDIDNSLVLSENVLSGAARAAYTPKAGALPVSIPLDLTDGQKITLSSDGYTVGIGVSASNQNVRLQSTAAVTAVDALASAGVSDTASSSSSANGMARTQQEIIREYNDEIMALDNRSSAVVYNNVFPQTNMEFIVTSTGVKNYAVVNAQQAEYVYRYDMDLGGLIPAAQGDGSILLNDQAGKAVFVIQTPYMFDANHVYSDAVTMELVNGLLTVKADAGWINDPGRVWPILIDPTVTRVERTGASNIDDTHVSSSWLLAGVNYVNSPNLYAGKLATGSFNRSYVKFNNFPTIPAGNTLTSAMLRIKNWDINAGYPVLVYNAMNYNWTPSSLTWNNQPLTQIANGLKSIGANLPMLTGTSGLSPSGQFYNIPITQAVQSWYANPSKTKGLVFTSVSETVNGQAAFHSSNTSIAAERPVLTITHTPAIVGSMFAAPAGSSYKYNHQLATIAMYLSYAAYNPLPSNTLLNIPDSFMTINDEIADVLKYGYSFQDVAEHNYTNSLWLDFNKAAHTIAHKEITIGGTPTSLIAVTIRGTAPWYDWATDALSMLDSQKVGFNAANNNARTNLVSYINTYSSKLKANRIVLVTGHSLGGAVANLLAADLNSGLVSGFNQNNVVAYTFASPFVGTNLSSPDSHENIFNILNSNDLFTYFPSFLVSGNWVRYGQDASVIMADAPLGMLLGLPANHKMVTYLNWMESQVASTTWENIQAMTTRGNQMPTILRFDSAANIDNGEFYSWTQDNETYVFVPYGANPYAIRAATKEQGIIVDEFAVNGTERWG